MVSTNPETSHYTFIYSCHSPENGYLAVYLVSYGLYFVGKLFMSCLRKGAYICCHVGGYLFYVINYMAAPC
jgi:hypothetical protein